MIHHSMEGTFGRSFGLGCSRALNQLAAACRAPISLELSSYGRVALDADAFHRDSVKAGNLDQVSPSFARQGTQAAGLIWLAMSRVQFRMAGQSRMSDAGIFFIAGRRVRNESGNGRVAVLHRPPKICRSAGLSHG